jgi:hypothetical protein
MDVVTSLTSQHVESHFVDVVSSTINQNRMETISKRERETDSHDPTQTKTKSVVVISNVDIVRTES